MIQNLISLLKIFCWLKCEVSENTEWLRFSDWKFVFGATLILLYQFKVLSVNCHWMKLWLQGGDYYYLSSYFMKNTSPLL